ncbi:MAG TPA: hypothetical protein VGH02_13900 [Rhizomicrobium sp.]|jgi:hypothetical protein
MLADGCVLAKEQAEGCVLHKEFSVTGCVLVKDAAGCVLEKEAAGKGCVLVKDEAGCVLHKDADAGCVLHKQADAGCVLAKDEAGCVLEKEAADKGCVLVKDAAGCVLVKDGKDNEVAMYLDRLNAWDLSLVKQQVVRKGIFRADEVDAIARDYKHFLALSCVADSGAVPVDPRVDEFWHAHILFTQDYAAMCKTVADQFLHHRPSILDEAHA